MPTTGEGEVVEVARATASGLPPKPAAAPPRMSPKDTRDSEQYRASNQYLNFNYYLIIRSIEYIIT